MPEAKITIDRANLMPALTLAQKAVARRSTIPILSNILIGAEDGRLTLTGTDLDVEISAVVDCAGAASAFTLPGQVLHDAVRKLPDGAEIAISADDRGAKVAAGRSRFSMPLLPATDYPRISAGDMPFSFDLSGADMARIIETVGFAISSEETRYYLNGIYLHVVQGDDGDRLVAVATDGHRLARIALPLPEGAAEMPGIIVPRRAIEMLKDFGGGKDRLAIDVSATRIRFSVHDEDGRLRRVLTSKLIDGTFPDYTRVIPARHGNTFTVAREEMKKAIDRVTTISSQRGSAVKFGFAATAVALATSNPDIGSAEDEVAVAASTGDDVEIGFNGRYCIYMLDAASGDRLVFHVGSNGDPARIEPEGDDSVTFVIMPMRV